MNGFGTGGIGTDGVPGAILHVIEEAPGSFRLLGELDISSIDAFAARIQAQVARGGDITIDLRGLTFMDSAGLHLLAGAASALQGRGGLRLVAPRRSVAKVIETTGLDHVVNLDVVGGDDGGGLGVGTALPDASGSLSPDPYLPAPAGR